MNIQEHAQGLTEALKDTDLKMNLTPELRVKHGIYSLIDVGQNEDHPLLVDEDTGEEILNFQDTVGGYSDEPDENYLEIALDDESISFWISIIADVFNDAPEYVTHLTDNIKSAQKLGFAYVRLTQY